MIRRMRCCGGRDRRTRFRQHPEPLPRQFVQCPDPEPRPQFRQPPFRRLLDQMGVAAAVERTPGRPGRNRGEEMPASDPRSEEHTSELQSLMRSSYADIYLKKKKNR